MRNLFIAGALLCYISASAQNPIVNSGNFKIHQGGTLGVFGDFINNGTLSDEGQELILSGNSLQKISGTSVSTFSNLTLDNPVGSTLTANQNLKGILTIKQGVFNTAGKEFTLLSDSSGTARIGPILGDLNGTITMQRFLKSGPTDWRQLASPVQGVTIEHWQDDFITSGFPGATYSTFPFVSVYTYDETVPGMLDYGYQSASSANDALTPGNGFFAYVGPTPVTVDVTGPPAKFNQTFSVSYTAGSGAVNDGYMLLGNPYPCAIDWTSSGWTKNNMNDAIYIWNPVLQQYASYVSGVSTNGGSPLIASSQAFWVQANAQNPSLSCNEFVKNTNTDLFIRPANVFSANLKLRLTGLFYGDETFIRFGSPATAKFDKQYDARKMVSTTPGAPSIASLDSMLNDMSVNSFPEFNDEIKIPVRTMVNQGFTGTYTISCDSTTSLPDNYCLLLEDLVTGIKTNLTPANSYTCFISDTTSAPRFMIHIRRAHSITSFAASCNGSADGKIVTSVKGQGPWNYTWKNSANTIIKTTTNSITNDSLVNVQAGNYYVSVTTPFGICGEFNSSVTVQQPEPVIANFYTSSSTVQAGVTSLTVVNLSYNGENFKWNFGDNSNISTVVNPSSHLYNSMGQYTVTLIAEKNGCTDKFEKVVFVTNDNVVNTEEHLNENKVLIYPNPGNGLFYISAKSGTDISRIEISDAAGRILYEDQAVNPVTQIDLRQLARGVYFYKVFSGETVLTGKLLLK